MDFLRIATYCFLISYLIFCHIVWNGCYNIYSSTEDEVYNMLYYRKREKRPVKLEIRNKLTVDNVKKVYVKKAPCPVLPRPIKSLFHLNWFRKSSDLVPISIHLYSMFDEKNNFLGFILLSSAIFTILEWMYIVYLASMLLWDGIIKPIFKLVYLAISVYLILRFTVIFLPYTKSFMSQENYKHISSYVFNFYNIIMKISKEVSTFINRVMQENGTINKEL
ncbi:Uncharacterized protein PCOAH_00049730 [Plasmodium coatneyi]|uniref:Uncharacterized protein n=1 Tax=Plasmodium coatneyi TaxID=208452 RepID=A0A1B1E7E3_9APIC|nr:Uncharacterized protein PCOAH_00049730 [Plasmodium coatneyi]ANQ10679.1 Uncharacterized protein PCOAH_00049730 [Plasmodium coatneyi]